MRRRSVLVIALALMLALPAVAATAGDTSEIVEFDPAQAQFPEGIAASKTGTLYVSWTLRDELVAIDPSGNTSVVARFPTGAAPAGIVVAANNVVYVAAGGIDLTTGTTDPETRGVYEIKPGETPQRIPGTEAMTFPNDVTLDESGVIYATDTVAGTVWRISRHGAPELWASDPLLVGTGGFGFGFPIGANGIAVDHKDVIVANPEKGLLVNVPIENDGSAGPATVLASSPLLLGADGIALDVHGNIYVVAGVQNSVVVVREDGSIDTLATADDGLNQPATLAFGSGRRDNRTLFITNFSVFAPEPTPGVLALPTGSPGEPVP